MNTTCVSTSAGLLAAFALVAASAAHAQTQELIDRADRHLESLRQELIDVRRDLHRHPEVSGQEERTAGVVAERLRALGLEVRTGVGGHGVVGLLRGGQPGPVVAFRADMDAVYSNAPDLVSFASETPGVRHICGHDIHTSVGLALAEALAAIREDLPGTVKFIFQPAEENIQGAWAMIEDGALEDPVPDVIFAFHTAPLQVGQIGSVEGPALPGLDRVTVTISGDGDLESAARAYASAVSSVNTGQAVAPKDFVGAMLGPPRKRSDEGDWVVGGMVRAGSPEARARAEKKIAEELTAVSLEGVSHEFEYEAQALPDMVNDPELVRSTLETIRSIVGDGLLEVNEVTPYFSEDFAFYQQTVPGAMYWLGVSNAALGTVGMPHSPDYVADEESIFVGAKVMTAVIVDYMQKS
jgi:amidohydrolase